MCYLPEAGLLDPGKLAFAAGLPLGCGLGTLGPLTMLYPALSVMGKTVQGGMWRLWVV